VSEIIKGQRVYQNTPYTFADFTSREKAHLALANLRVLPGIKATIVGE
jgi:hypothetical protein